MANPRNIAAVEELRSLLKDGGTFFLVDYQGLSAEDLNALRSKVRAEGGRILVAKNTLISVVLKEQGVEDFDDQLKGPRSEERRVGKVCRSIMCYLSSVVSILSSE